jgi:DNA-directed RNA polymerase specialized sigma24 family protein
MTIVSIDTHRGAFRTRGRSNGGPGESVDQDPRIHEDKNMAPGRDDHARFARLVLPHLGDAYSLARWITGSRADAEDVVQDACLRAFRAIGSLADGSARPWVLTIVRNTAYTWLLQARRPGADGRMAWHRNCRHGGERRQDQARRARRGAIGREASIPGAERQGKPVLASFG